MVTEGQLLERPVIIPAPVGCLDGIYLRGDSPGIVIASPLPGTGGSMTTPLGNEVAYAAARSGRASLRLDYRGVGASEGESSSCLDDAAVDLKEGVDFLLETIRGRSCAIAGIGSGCWAALRAAQLDPRIDRVLLVSPPRRELVPGGLPSYAELRMSVLVVVGEREPSVDIALESSLTSAGQGRLKVLKEATAGLREALSELARLVPPFLGAQVPE